MSVSAATHVALFVILSFVLSRMPDPLPEQRPAPSSIVWMPQAGPGGGGGGGGNRMADPPRRAESRGRERVNAPAARPAQPSMRESTAARTVDIPALPAAAGLTEMPGVVSGAPGASLSLGPGADGAGGPGRGGIGRGDGPGLEDGSGGGTGGGSYQPGTDGVTYPQLIREVAPAYTNGALQARIQGIVALRAEVLADGSVGRVWITRSLDEAFGLDREAERTVKQWRFVPAKQRGRGVPVVVPIELRFTIR